MATVTIATWNINSVRLRIGLVLDFLKEYRPDVLCLQEIKTREETFPFEPIREAGWSHIAVAGFKGYNGVATLSRLSFTGSQVISWCDRNDGRHVRVTFEDGLELHNVYVPSGGDVPDPGINDKFAHKLDFLRDMTAWWSAISQKGARRILVGDLNIAPLENDVWSHRKLIKAVSHTPVEVAALESLQTSHDWIDTARHFVPATEKLYSWWPYRSGRDWSVRDHGRRLDHIWITPALKPSLESCETLRHMRGRESPSDHVPVITTLELGG